MVSTNMREAYGYRVPAKWRGAGARENRGREGYGRWEMGEERAGGRISTMAESGREIQKGSQRNKPNNVSSLPFNVFRGLRQNLYTRQVKKRKFVLGPVKSEKKNKKQTALLPVKLETFPSRLHQDMNEIA